MAGESASVFGYTTVDELAKWAIPDETLALASVDDVKALPSFRATMRRVGQKTACRFGALPLATQEAILVRRLAQIVASARVNPVWRERLAAAPASITSMADWAQIPLTDKATATDMFTGTRPGMVVPISDGGFQIVASGGTSNGQPSETVYELTELRETYQAAGIFIGRHMLPAHMGPEKPGWLATTLADYQMWSSGTMVGGVLAHVRNVNYVGAGPVSASVFSHLMGYPGPKAIMGISASIAMLPSLGQDLSPQARASLRVAMYGSGQMSRRACDDLRAAFPNVSVLSYFAATQAEAIGLQLVADSPMLATIPGLHLVEVVDSEGHPVAVGEEGELVVTRLLANQAPVLRYVVGDRVIRRPDLVSRGLNTTRFEFVGRSADVLHIGDTQYSARRALTEIFEQFRERADVDLEAQALDVQFVNDRRTRELVLLVSTSECEALKAALVAKLGPEGSAPIIAAGLIKALSVFNSMEANEFSLARSGYFFGTRIVPPDSPEIMRTNVGKVPLLADRI